jgi:hypothetical protein
MSAASYLARQSRMSAPSSSSSSSNAVVSSSSNNNDAALSGNIALQTNRMTAAYAQRFFDDFTACFEITPGGTLRATIAQMRKVEDWFNRSYVLISLITGVPLDPIAFNYDLGKGKIQNKNANCVSMMHIYAVSYAVLLRMAATLNKPIPDQYRPSLQAVEAGEEEGGE